VCQFAAISCAELVQKKNLKKINIFTSKIAKFIQNPIFQRLGARRNLWAARLTTPESINKLPEAIYARIFFK
jgi:hypothetical protein